MVGSEKVLKFKPKTKKKYLKTRDSRIKKIDGWYFARFTLKGQKVFKSLKTQNFETATALVEELQQKILLGKILNAPKELIEDLWPKFIQDKHDGWGNDRPARASTLRHYDHTWTRYFKDFWSHKLITDLTEDNWKAYLASVEEKRPGLKFFNHCKYFGSFKTWALKKQLIQHRFFLHNPDRVKAAHAKKTSREVDGAGKVYSDQELEDFRNCSTGPLKVAIYMAQYMGMRRAEMNQLPVEQIHFDKNYIQLWAFQTKNNKDRQVPIHPKVLGLLKAQVSKDSPYLFPNALDKSRPMSVDGFSKAWNRLCEELGIEGGLHDFRHTYLTNTLKQPHVAHMLICTAAGLSIVTAQRVYLHFSDKDLQVVTHLDPVNEIKSEEE